MRVLSPGRRFAGGRRFNAPTELQGSRRFPGAGQVLGPFQFEPAAGERNALAWVGLSYVFGDQGFPEISTAQPYSNVEARNATSRRVAGSPLLEPLVSEVSREPIYVAAANQLAHNWAAALDWIVHDRAIGGSTIGDHNVGSTSYNNHLAMVDDALGLVAPDSVVYRALCEEGLGFVDAVINGTPWATVEATLLAIREGYEAEIQTRTGQSAGLPLFLDQFGFWRMDATAVSPVGALEQLALALSDPDVFSVGPGSVYNVGGDNVHLTNLGYLAMGLKYGEVMYQVLGRGIDWRPLYATSAEIGPSNTVVLTFHVPSTAYGRAGGGAQLVLDETAYGWREAVADAVTHGFRYVEGANPARAVTGVSVSGDQIEVQLDGAPVAGAHIGINDFGAQPPNGPRCNLRDNWTNPSGVVAGDEEMLFNWASTQQVVIA